MYGTIVGTACSYFILLILLLIKNLFYSILLKYIILKKN